MPPGERGYIPYRDSKLTRLLQPSLGGNAKITIICTVTGALLSSDETHNTLKFANRAKRMKNHAAINEVSNEKVGRGRWWQDFRREKTAVLSYVVNFVDLFYFSDSVFCRGGVGGCGESV